MEIPKILVLRGPNVWANFPVIEVWVDLRPNLDVPTNTFPGFVERIKTWLPSLVEHRCGVGERGGFFQRLDEGTYLGHVLEHVSLELQSLVGPAVGYGRARETSIPGLYRVAVRYADERLGLACVKTAIRLLDCARTGESVDVAVELRQLRQIAERHCVGPGTQAIVSAAKERLIPSIRLAGHNLVQFGYGSAQRRIWTAETDQTSAIAESIAQDKELTRKLLGQAGVPVPRGRGVKSADAAWEAAEELGLPVVVKPREGNHGRGVSIDLTTRDQVRQAFDIANAEAAGVIVEQCIPGHHHRLLVVGNRVVAAAEGEPDYVTGDGAHKIRELVDLANQQPDRGDQQIHQNTQLELDAIALEVLGRQGFTVDSVPQPGQRAILHFNGDLPIDVTSRVHPEIARVAVLAAKTVGLNIAGIDFVLRDISRPIEEQKGAVLEVNASPGLVVHLKPRRGTPQPVGEAIVQELFAPETTGRVPLVAVSGTNGKSTVMAKLQTLLAKQRPAWRLGVAGSEGLFVDGRALVRGVATDHGSVERLLVNPIIDCILVEMAPRTVLEEGMAFDRCQVAVVTNAGSLDHLGLDAMTRERMLLVERCGVDAVLPDGTAVLNADDPDVLSMAPKCRGKVLLFSRDADGSPLLQHRAQGGRTVAVRSCRIEFEEGTAVMASFPCPSQLVPSALENLLASLGAAWSLGIEPNRDVLESCLGNERMHFAYAGNVTVFATMARNPSAFTASLEALDALGSSFARRIAIQSYLPVDWRDEDAFMVGQTLAKAFDQVHLLPEALLAEQQIPEAEPPLETPSSSLVDAFKRGVSSINSAKLVILPTVPKRSWSTLLAESLEGDLLSVQLGDYENFASFALSEEAWLASGGSSGTVSPAHRDPEM